MRRLRRIHRWIGVFASGLTLWLAVSGLLLVYAPQLGWHERFVTTVPLLRLYGIDVESSLVGYRLDLGPAAQVDERVFLGTHRVAVEGGPLVGAARDRDGYVIALADAVLRVDAQGNVLDRAGSLEGIPVPIARVGTTPRGDLVLDTRSGRFVVASDFLDARPWVALSDGAPRWSIAERLAGPGAPLPDELAAAYLDGVISFERLLADLHTGRLGGAIGERLVDVGGIAMIVLALSGLWLFARTR